MVDDATGVVLTFNGEIAATVNWSELGKRTRIQSSSDTEVVLRAYLEFGTEMFSRLNGILHLPSGIRVDEWYLPRSLRC